MREVPPAAPAIVVGIDGSRSAINAALWAVAEATDRDIPLRLIFAITPRPSSERDGDTAAADFAAAESAVRQAVTAIESLDQPVKIEVEIIQGPSTETLVNASRTAAMVCVGALGLDRATGRRLGSTAALVVARTHCPVAIIDDHRNGLARQGWVVAEVDNSAESHQVLDLAVREARLRRAPLRVVTSRRDTDTDDASGTARLAMKALERALERWRHRYPDLDIRTAVTVGSPTHYLERHADSIQLVVVHPDRLRNAHGPREIPTRSALRDLRCSVLVAGRHSAL